MVLVTSAQFIRSSSELYSGWLLEERNAKNLVKTELTHLPPIHSNVTEFKTIINYMLYLQKLAEEVNMPYVNVTLDMGATIYAFKV